MAEYVWNTSDAQRIGVNPHVPLVTAGMAPNWRIPKDKDLKDAIDEVGVRLNQYHFPHYGQVEALHEDEQILTVYMPMEDIHWGGMTR